MREAAPTFEAQAITVATISFGTIEWATAWLTETQSPFPFLLDPERRAYQAYGLERSVWRSWSLSNLLYYARALLFQGRSLYPGRGDPNQLGGDFVVDRTGQIRYAHPSHTPLDRPSASRLLEVVAGV